MKIPIPDWINRQFLLSAIACAALAPVHPSYFGVIASAQSAVPGKVDAQKRIRAIVSDILKRGEMNFNGVNVVIRALPRGEELKEVKSFGDDAVPVLGELLLSQDARVSELAMRFLGTLGGRRIVPALEKVISSDPSPAKRELAVRWLAQAPLESACPIWRKVANADRNLSVRKVAKGLLLTWNCK